MTLRADVWPNLIKIFLMTITVCEYGQYHYDGNFIFRLCWEWVKFLNTDNI